MKKKNAAMWLICFALLLLGPRVVWTAAADRFATAATENTVVTEFPKLTRESFGGYGASLESYFDSNVPFRSQLISFNSLVDIKLFSERSINDKVVLGDNNWLFYSEESNIDDYKGSNLYSEEQLLQIARNLSASKAYLDKRGCEFVVFIAPNKETIYGEGNLPSYYKKGELTRAQQVVEYLRENTDVRVVFPVEELLEYRDEYSLYWHYDTHWNVGGGYIGSRALLKELGIELPPVEEVTYTPDVFSEYDLARMMNLQEYYEEKMPDDVNYFVTGYPFNNMQTVSGDSSAALVYHSDSPDERKLFLVWDSFAGAMVNVLASSFRDCYMVGWNISWEQSMIEEQEPDVFVLELGERRMDYLSTFCLTE